MIIKNIFKPIVRRIIADTPATTKKALAWDRCWRYQKLSRSQRQKQSVWNDCSNIEETWSAFVCLSNCWVLFQLLFFSCWQSLPNILVRCSTFIDNRTSLYNYCCSAQLLLQIRPHSIKSQALYLEGMGARRAVSVLGCVRNEIQSKRVDHNSIWVVFRKRGWGL